MERSGCLKLKEHYLRCRQGLGEGFTKEYLARGVRQQYVRRCSSAILESGRVKDEALIKSPPSERRSKLRVREPSADGED